MFECVGDCVFVWCGIGVGFVCCVVMVVWWFVGFVYDSFWI